MKSLLLLITALFVFDVNAQMLSLDSSSKSSKENFVESVVDSNVDPVNQISQALNKNMADGGAASEVAEQQKEDIFIPEGELHRLNTPTFDGSTRGGKAFVEVDDKGRMKKVDNIFLFYDNFKVTNYLASGATCDVRFNILSNLDRKITALDIKLVWPGMTTALSFADVKPNTQTYYNYSLIGDGCYNMDKAPNIIVNRCRKAVIVWHQESAERKT